MTRSSGSRNHAAGSGRWNRHATGGRDALGVESPTARAIVQAEIAEARGAFMGALRRGDSTAAAQAYTDDARLMAPSAELLTGRSSIAGFWQAGLDAGVVAVELEAMDIELEPSGGVAYEIGHYVLRLQPVTGDRVVDRGRYLLVYRREADGAWRRAVETFSPDRPPSSEQSLADEATALALAASEA